MAKAGYVEIPSRLFEQSRGHERGIVGLSHHRWLIELEGSHLKFYQKYHSLHGDTRLSFPGSFLKSLPPEKLVTWLFWDGSFSFEEVTIHGLEAIREEFSRFLRANYRPPAPRAAMEAAKAASRYAADVSVRGVKKLARLARGAKLLTRRVEADPPPRSQGLPENP